MFKKLLKKIAVVSASFVFTFASVIGVEATMDMTPAAYASEDANGCINNGTVGECSNTASYTEFDSIWNRIAAWTQGSLGRVIAGAFILVGIVGGVAKQSIMSFAIGISAGLGLIYAPGILASLFSADVSVSALSEEVLQHAVAMLQNHGLKSSMVFSSNRLYPD